MKTKLTIIGVLILCICASLIIPKVADATATLRRMPLANIYRDRTPVSRLSEPNSPQESEDAYVPPDYGAPDSQHGSGTR